MFSYLLNFSTKNNKEIKMTHTRIGCKTTSISGGSYHIPDEKHEEFMERYHSVIFKDPGLSQHEFLTEKQLEIGPFAIDLDFRYDPSVTTRQHTTDDITDIVLSILDVLKTIYRFKNNDSFTMYVSEKPKVNCQEVEKGYTKDGLHFIIGIQADTMTQIMLRDKLIPVLKKDIITLPLTNAWADVVDESVAKRSNNWQLLGSRKPGNDCYALKRIYMCKYDKSDGEFEIHPSNVEEVSLDLFREVSVRNPNHPSFPMTEKFESLWSEKTNQKRKPREAVVEDAMEPNLDDDDYKKNVFFFETALERGLLDELAISQANWMSTLWIIKNVFGDFDMFDRFSQRCPSKYNKFDCRDEWDRHPKDPNGKKIGTLSDMIKENHPAELKKLNNDSSTSMRDRKRQKRDLEKKQDMATKQTQSDINKTAKQTQSDITKAAKQTQSEITKAAKQADKVSKQNASEEDRAAKKVQKEADKAANYKKNMEDTEDVEGVWDDEEAAKRVLELYPYWHNCHNTLFVFDKATGKHNSDTDSHFAVLQTLKSDLHLLGTDKDGKTFQRKESYGGSTVLKRQVIAQIKAKTRQNDWLDEKDDSSRGFLLFKNGYLNMITGVFYSEFTPDILFFHSINLDYEEAVSEEDRAYMERIKFRFFTEPLGDEVGDSLLLNIARALAAEHTKRIHFCLGDTNRGKSVLTDAIENAFGGYFGTFNAECMAHTNTTTDNAAQLRWFQLLRHARIIISNELNTLKELDGNMMKKLTGGDSVVARTHGKEEQKFRSHATLMVCCNDMCKIVPLDTAGYLRVIMYQYTKEYVVNPSNSQQLLRDPNLSAEIKTVRFRRFFLRLLTERFHKFVTIENRIQVIPEAMEIAKKEWLAEPSELDITKLFLEEHEITGDERDFRLSSKALDYWIRENLPGVSVKRFIKCLKVKAAGLGLDIESKMKMDNSGGFARKWVGITINDRKSEDEPINRFHFCPVIKQE